MNVSTCSFGKRIFEDNPTEFDIKYLAHQASFAYEELGDQLDEREDVVLEIAGDSAKLLGEEYCLNVARAINYCLQQRYLGNCATGNCGASKTVTETIEEVSTLTT